MTNETYIALGACARKRIEHEWSCSSAERAILQFITDLSFDLGQTWAFVPCLADFAAVLDIHKSTVSRALRSALKKGYLLVLQRRDETLYSICTETRGNVAPADETKAKEVRARLVALNQTRLQGHADPDGQQRLPGVLPSEETAAPARALAAMIEAPEQLLTASEQPSGASKEPLHETMAVPRATSPPPAMQADTGDGAEETWDETERRIQAMVRAAERSRGEIPAPPGPSSPPSTGLQTPKTGQETSHFEREMIKLCRGLGDQERHAMERLREEFQTGGKLQEAAFFKWGRQWRDRAKKHPRECLEVAGEHKNLRLTSGSTANEPGAWMYRALEDLLRCNSK